MRCAQFMRKIKLKWYLLGGLLGLTLFASSQDTTTRPIVRHKRNSSMPNNIKIRGKIVEISYGYCGIFCIGATIKVELKEKVKNYNEKYAYVVVPCLQEPPKDSTVTVKATKLHLKEKACYFNSINNIIDSRGIPFYKLDEVEANKIILGTTHNMLGPGR